MKLKIKPPIVTKKPLPKINSTGFENPVGWWKVSTEGDCEGRSTNQLGEYYGHVAEIAFHLADKSYYKLTFDAIKNREKGKRIVYQATKDKVWIALGIESGTWDMNHDNRAKYIAEWLDAKEEIEVLPTDGGARYYAGAFLKLK